jgi:hypothetical protein
VNIVIFLYFRKDINMGIPSAPLGLFVNYFGNVSYLVWDAVEKDTSNPPLPINVIGYFIFKTQNPAGLGWSTPFYAYVDSTNPYGQTDVHYVDYSAIGDAIYKVCPWDGTTDIVGQCSIGYGVANEGSITIPADSKWDEGLWDESLFG